MPEVVGADLLRVRRGPTPDHRHLGGRVDIVGAVGLSKGTVSKAVNRLVEAGFLVRDENGGLTVPTAGEARV